ncbi:VOC family protein [Actinoplanes sp. NPDC051861]|uniref:VOC family protein n=1 Tax=Actinoplanes sp. NPDC051861 TaxID=3155170 RepID=UPI00342641A2
MTAAHPRLDHVGLNVADLAAAESWYTLAFGLRVEMRLRVAPVGLDIVMLISDEHGYRLELLYRDGGSPGARADSPAAAVLSHGFGHVAFGVPDLEKAYRHLLALGAKPVMAPCPSPESGVDMAYVADPEGNLLELLDRRPS